jgi:G3E family GTPase
VILLNKIDLAPESQTDSLEAIVRKINPVAAVHRTSRSNIDLKFIMGIDAYSSRIPDAPAHSHNHTSGEACHDDPTPQTSHYTLRGITSILVPIPSLPAERVQVLDEWIRSVLWENRLPDSTFENPELQILRCKGMFHSDTNKTFVLQGVRDIYELAQLDVSEDNHDADGVGDVGKLVFIGKGLTDDVRRSLERIVRVADQ